MNIAHLLSLVAHFGWDLHQCDVKNAFLHGDLEDEMYMEIPARIGTTSGTNQVWRFRKTLYGQKYYSYACFGRFTKAMGT